MTVAGLSGPDLQPEDERTAILQRLDQYRAIAVGALADVPWEQASARLLPATDMTIAGIVKHLAWAEDRWFQGRLLGSEMPAPGIRLAPMTPTTRCAWWRATPPTGSSTLRIGVRTQPRHGRPVRLAQSRRRGPVVRDRTGQPSLDPRPHDRRDSSTRRTPRSAPGLPHAVPRPVGGPPSCSGVRRTRFVRWTHVGGCE